MAAGMALACHAQGNNQDTQGEKTLGNNRFKALTIGQTMNYSSCANYSWAKVMSGLNCTPGCHVPHTSTPCETASVYHIGYWEPSEIIEVSCRSGYSMLKPGSVPMRGGGNKAYQSCYRPTGKGTKLWFFEARDWAINGEPGKLRHQSSMGMGGAEGLRQCSNVRTSGGDTWDHKDFGYGSKKDGFSKGPANGPGGAWEAYISDNDPNWANDSGASAQAPQAPQVCKHGDKDVEKCWGNTQGHGGQTGWVAHPNQSVAAALVAWRAHLKALSAGRVAKAPNYKMEMDYPFIHATSPFASSMGLTGGNSYKGSKCFTPGDAGPSWYSHNEQDFTPDQIPGMVQKLTSGTAVQAAELHPGVYVFVIWVKTSCMRYQIKNHLGGPPFPTPICHYTALE